VRNRVARVNANGSLDATFALDAGGRTLASVTQADGKIDRRLLHQRSRLGPHLPRAPERRWHAGPGF
jgi:hypothetical protein